MKVLELFKGSGSITKYYKNRYDVEVISLDILKKYNPTICCDIMDWNYKIYQPGYFDIIWASPECKIFSMLQNSLVGRKWENMEHLREVRAQNSHFINRTIEIIKYFKPKKYFIENPRYSAIWKYIQDKEFVKKNVLVDYCYFGYNYKKPTKILTNKNYDNKFCSCKNHKMRLGITTRRAFNRTTEFIKDKTSLLDRYSIPQGLLEYLLGGD